ncbi:endonuclease [Nocardioides sp. MAH-18]|uniref:Endonuclease n=1 Tax=Nocardioides agri TaxID=2682843 RepID=A0A6L6Y1J7_9ACTN|nr:MULTISPECIES: endonuclease/exonuclease/phosphatase family protein [unclassified Nocardioides]MBA2952283.1 endonuclease/exonuclease/phosphatase family protein [Nocardioides sp. CGMCC 1.13656]MVQ51445.1 endonuclease [Nocardioides sp. MAH-18]
MRLATFNILHGSRHHGDEHVDPRLLADAVRELDADVLALQEVDRNQSRSAHADLTAVAAEAMGAVDHRFVAALAGSPGATWTAATGAEHPESAGYGVALLSRHPVAAWEVVRLPGAPVPAPWVFHGQRLPRLVRDEPRVAVAAQVELPAGGCVTVATTHLSFLTYWNRRQLAQLRTALADARRPLLLTGDLNMGSGPATRVSRLRSLAARPTFPAHRPAVQIDHVLADGRVRAVRAEACRLAISDHLALVVDLELG